MAGTNPDLVVRVAANIAALQTDMASAVASIKSIEGAVKGAGEATGGFVGWLDKMGDSFVAHVTEGVLLRDAIRELITLGKEAVTETAALEDLARATGINTTALQQFIYVGKEFGVGTDQMVRGVEQLSAKLANGDANATRAVQALGLSVKDLIASGPQEAFLSIAEAVGRVEDPMLKNGLATELFGGKLGKILIPMLADLRQKMEEVPKDAIISKENVEKAHEFEVGLEHLILRAKAYTVEVLGGIIAYEKWLERQSGVTDATDTFGHALERVTTGRGQDIALTHAAISAADLLANRLQALRAEALEPLSDAQKGQIVELEAFGVSHKEIAQLVGTTEIAIKKYTDSLKEQEKAVKAAAEEVKKWDELLTHLHSETFKLAMEHEKQWREESLKATQRSNVAILAEFDAQTKLNAEWGRNAAGAIQLQSSALDVLNQKLAELHANRVEGISQEKQEQVLMDAYTKALFDEAVAQDHVAIATEKASQSTAAVTGNLNAYRGTVNLVAQDLASLNAELTTFYDALDAHGAAGAMGYGPSGIGVPGRPLGYRTPGIQARAGGGPVDAGSPYVVGERGPELFVPQASGSIMPTGGGPSIVNHIYVTQPLGTPGAIAAAVDQALTARLRNTGQRF